MLAELAVSDLGVIADLTLVLGPGMTAVTGETGTGKTLIVEAIELLVGGRADTALVRPGATQATVEGRFLEGDEETVLTRVVPAAGRSRAYVDGRLAPVAALAERGARLVDLHGQHAHQSLLGAEVQRAALDRFAALDLDGLRTARRSVAAIDARLAELGGDASQRARELDFLRYELRELEAAGVADPSEDENLAAAEQVLADAAAHRDAAHAGHHSLTGDDGALDALGTAVTALGGRALYAEIEQRLRAASAEVADAAADLRAAGEGVVDDPARLEQVRQRRQHLRELCRKYGVDLAGVVARVELSRQRIEELTGHTDRVKGLEAERSDALTAVAVAAAEVGRARRAAAPSLASAVTSHLSALAMAGASVEVTVGEDDPGDAVAFLLAANPGEPALALAKVASGGELARAMLALRLVLTAGPPVLVFDEVDAGIGGAAALAVGRSLARLAGLHQVLVVTHLPQVAAFADAQVAVSKETRSGRTVARARPLDGGERVIELSRMLSGHPESDAARGHAEELLAVAAQARGR